MQKNNNNQTPRPMVKKFELTAKGFNVLSALAHHRGIGINEFLEQFIVNDLKHPWVTSEKEATVISDRINILEARLKHESAHR
ncbi:hypothetical protein [Microcoleus sp. herbarium14]|uniref:hypothetical protein n=1 Tax=Microcoleus sp. herbarium14 TaxID=3055439 RepID=UPI002FCF2B6C